MAKNSNDKKSKSKSAPRSKPRRSKTASASSGTTATVQDTQYTQTSHTMRNLFFGLVIIVILVAVVMFLKQMNSSSSTEPVPSTPATDGTDTTPPADSNKQPINSTQNNAMLAIGVIVVVIIGGLVYMKFFTSEAKLKSLVMKREKMMAAGEDASEIESEITSVFQKMSGEAQMKMKEKFSDVKHLLKTESEKV